MGLFHEFSELAMRADVVDVEQILERINHCFLNPLSPKLNLPEIVDGHRVWNCAWEADLIARVATIRAFAAGKYYQKGD